MSKLTQEGTFKFIIKSWGLVLPDATKADASKSVGITLALTVAEEFDFAAKSWTSWLADQHGVALPPVDCYGTIYIIGRNGQENSVGIEHAVDALAWNGDLTRFKTAPADGMMCIADVKREEYRSPQAPPNSPAIVSFKPSWWYPITHNPADRGALRNVATADEIQKLADEIGARMRAAVGQRK